MSISMPTTSPTPTPWIQRETLSLARLPVLRGQHPADTAATAYVDVCHGQGFLYVNMYAGSKVRIDDVAGTKVRIEQTTDYPWKGHVAIVVHLAKAKKFAIHLREPTRDMSRLYASKPSARDDSLTSLAVNGSSEPARSSAGYQVIARTWRDGDRIDFDIPLEPQRIKADEEVVADRGRGRSPAKGR